MPTYLLLKDGDKYPFGQSSSENNYLNRTLVKETLEKSDANLSSLLKICQLSKKLSENKILIRMEKILEEDNTLCLHYEYIPIQLSKYIEEMDEKFIKQYRNEMFEIGSLLAENRIICELSMERMGLSENYEAKYFLGVDFVQKKQVNIFELKNDYVEEIKLIFQPYLNRKNTESSLVSKKPTKNLVRVDTRMSDTQEIESSYIEYNNLIKTRKHESIYYERTKDQEIKKRKESYMSSVSNLRLNNLYKRINEIELQVCNTRGSNGKYTGNGSGGFKMSIEGREFLAKSSFGGSSAKKSIMESQENQMQLYKGINNIKANFGNKNINLGFLQRNSITTPNINKNILQSVLNKNKQSNFIKYPGYDQEDDDYEQINYGEESPRYNGTYTHAKLEMSAHQITTNNFPIKQSNKKFSSHFPTLSDFEQPITPFSNALRVSANGLDSKNERKPNKKIELFKEREYSEIKSVSGNTNYIRDFMSVLEEESSTNEKTSKNNENENLTESQEDEEFPLIRPLQIKIDSTESIEDVGFTPFSHNLNQKGGKETFGQYEQGFKTHSYNSIPQNQTVTNCFYPNSCKEIRTENKFIKSKVSIEETLINPDIHNRVKGVIENSKKLIEKLREKAKKHS